MSDQGTRSDGFTGKERSGSPSNVDRHDDQQYENFPAAGTSNVSGGTYHHANIGPTYNTGPSTHVTSNVDSNTTQTGQVVGDHGNFDRAHIGDSHHTTYQQAFYIQQVVGGVPIPGHVPPNYQQGMPPSPHTQVHHGMIPRGTYLPSPQIPPSNYPGHPFQQGGAPGFIPSGYQLQYHQRPQYHQMPPGAHSAPQYVRSDEPSQRYQGNQPIQPSQRDSQTGPMHAARPLNQSSRANPTSRNLMSQAFERPVPYSQGRFGYEPPQNSIPDEEAKPLTDKIIAYPSQAIAKMAHVYPGKQMMGCLESKYRLVAVKLVRHDNRKMREAQNLVSLTPHVNVVSVIHADLLVQSFEKRIYIVMEMCNPLTLERYIESRKETSIPFNPSEALDFTKQLIDGMDHIHRNNIIHRDLKPSSVLFSLCGKYLKIIDFGLSKALQNGCSLLSVSTLPIGIDGYRAPETYKRNLIKKESDIFSLAILIYHILSYGYHPFGEITLWSYNIKENKPYDLSRILVPNAELAKDLLRGMLKNDANERSKIDDIRLHEFYQNSSSDILTSTVQQVWSGSIKLSQHNEKLDDCILYKDDAFEDDGLFNSWDLDMFVLPSVAVRIVKEKLELEKAPNGYLAVKKSSIKIIVEKLKDEDSMGWIGFSNDSSKRNRALLLIHPKDYGDEVYGIMVRNPDRLISDFQSDIVQRRQHTNPKELFDSGSSASAADGQAASQLDQKMLDTFNLLSSLQRQQPMEPSSPSEIETEEEDVQSVTPAQAVPPSRTPVGERKFISWWIYTPPESGTIDS